MMSKDGSEDVVEEEQGQEEVLATAVTPSTGVGAIRIRHILERVSPPHSNEYRILLTEAGFDTLESLTLPYSEFREDVKGMKPGHARALLTMVAEERERMGKPRKLDYVEQGTPPVPVSIRDNSIEKRALAGKFPKFPSNEEDDQRKVHAWFVGVAAWSRVWSLDIASMCVYIERNPNKSLAGSGMSIESDRFKEEDAYWGNCFLVEHQSDSLVMGLLTGAQKDCPTMTEILARLASIFALKNADYITELRIEFTNMTPCTQEYRLESELLKWEELREELKTRGNEQGSMEVLSSLKLLLSGLPKIKAMLGEAKIILSLDEIGFDRMHKIAKGCAKEWVRLKPKSNPKPTPKPTPRHNPKPSSKDTNNPPNPTPNEGSPPSKDGVSGGSVMMGSKGSKKLWHCDNFVFKHRHCPLKGATEGGVNDGVSQCKFLHDPSMENTDPEDRIAHFNTIPCKWGSEADCPFFSRPGGCHHKHS